MCTIGAMKYMLYGVFLDEYVKVIIQTDFFYERLIDIVLNLVAICCMITLFRDEVGEIYRQKKNYQELNKDKKQNKKK